MFKEKNISCDCAVAAEKDCYSHCQGSENCTKNGCTGKDIHHSDCGYERGHGTDCGYEHTHEAHCDCNDHSHNSECSCDKLSYSSGCGCGGGHSHQSECGCGCEHEKLSVKEVAISGAVFIAAVVLGKFSDILSAVLFVVAYIVAGYKILISAAKNIAKGKIFDENFLMSLASIGAIIIGEYPEAAAVMLFYRVGEYLQDGAVDKSRKSITELMDVRPDYANVLKDGSVVRTAPEEVLTDDVIVVKNGEKVPLDGIVYEGKTVMDTVALTGESIPRSISEGEKVLGGFINTGGTVLVKVTAPYHESTVSKILEITEHAREKKAKAEQFITKFSRYYTPVVVMAALLIAFIPPIFTGGILQWVYRALVFLVVSCPCALVVSVPLGFFAGIGAASRNGILIKGGCYIEALSKLKTVVFDKTGTLTHGKFSVYKIHSEVPEDELIRLAAHTEAFSNHPAAKAILALYGKDVDAAAIKDSVEFAGKGAKAVVDTVAVLCGNRTLMEENGITLPCADEDNGTIVYVSADGRYIGHFCIRDTEKEDSAYVISQLKKCGINTYMLTGDGEIPAKYIGKKLGIDNVFYELLPNEKTRKLEEIIAKSEGAAAFAGDGINDAPSLARADIGIAMGAMGSDSAVEAADVVLMTDELSKILKAVKISKKTMTVIKQNIIFALGAKLLIMLTGALGITGIWLAIFADVGVTLIAVLNSLRAMK